nr:patatin-like phospholipase family protein [Donghicola mangrovi]
MKGGTTSGVVYPPAIALLGKHFRLRSVGGTSAGAMAATVAAAAEYRRQTSDGRTDASGFAMVEALSSELGDNLTRFLQPSKDMEPLFDAILDCLDLRADPENKPSMPDYIKTIWPHLKPYRKKAARNGSLIAGGSAVAGFAGLGFGLGALGVFIGGGWFLGQLAYSAICGVHAQLKANDYGMVPGTSQRDGMVDNGISDWLARKIDEIAGIAGSGKPLTTGDLANGRGDPDGSGKEKPGIAFAAMTTDLTSQRPFRLPMMVPELYFFNPAEFERIIPKNVVDYMVSIAVGKRIEGPGGKDLFPMPTGGDFPVVLIARMSLSFPILLQAVPLYRKDHGAKPGEEWVRCLFSDGGIASNLPVHFFDAWLPSRPTFAISLGSINEGAGDDATDRLVFEQGKWPRRKMKVNLFKNVVGFFAAIGNVAKDWQDSLQSEVPGMHERIVTIRLKNKEGGSNINMTGDTIKKLQGYGLAAAEKLVNDFDYNEHRWRRALCLLPELEKNLIGVAKVVNDKTSTSYTDLVRQHVSETYPNTSEVKEQALLPLLKDLAELGEKIDKRSKTNPGNGSEFRVGAGNLPEYDAHVRIVASPDFSPRNGLGAGAGV